MVEHAHGEQRIEGLGRLQFLESAGQQLVAQRDRLVDRCDIAADGGVLHHEYHGGVYPEHAARAGGTHPPAVIAVATTHVEYAATGERLQVGCDPCPFPIGAPLAVDLNAEQRPGSFAPGLQLHQQMHQCAMLSCGCIRRLADRDGRVELERGGTQRG